MDLRERKQIINGATEKLPEYNDGKPNKWLHAPSAEAISGMATTGINFAGSVMNSFGGVKSAGDILQESGTSVGLGSGFSYLKQNSIDGGAQMDELSKQNTANTLNTAASGASLGSAFGPIGAGIGGVVGGAVGFIGGLFRKNKMAERIRQALILAVRNNNFNLASAQTDYLTNLYNVEHDNTQDDMLYAAKDGKKPLSPLDNAMKLSGFVLKNGRYVFDGHAMMSNGEAWGHIDPFTGEVLDLQKVGKGRDNKDTVKVKMGDTPEEVQSTFVVPNKGGASQYTLATGDVAGGLQIGELLKMDGHNKVAKAIRNGAFDLPTDILTAKRGKLPRFVGGFEPQEVNKESDDVLYKRNTTSKSPMEMLKEAMTNDPAGALHFIDSVGGGPVYTNELERRFEENPNMKDSSSWTNPNDWVVRNGNLVSRQQAALDDANKNIYNSNWLNAAVNSLPIFGGIALLIKSQESVANDKTYYQNPYIDLAAQLMLNRRSNLNQQREAAANAMAVDMYNRRRRGGSSGAQNYLGDIFSGIQNLRLLSLIYADDRNWRSGVDKENATFLASAGNLIGQQNAYYDNIAKERYHRGQGMKWANFQEALRNMMTGPQAFAKGYDRNVRFKSILPFYTTDFKHIV